MERWSDRVALVTGATSGIGTAIVHRLAKAGMRVVASGRRAQRLEALVDELKDAKGEVLAVPCDLRSPDSIAEMFGIVRNAWGGVDAMINNAGLGYDSALMDGDTEKWREMLDVNVLALSICSREAVADMRTRGDDGHVIHLGSMSGYRVAGAGLYTATKFAVRALTEALRMELRAAGSHIRVSAVSPGFTETGFHEIFYDSADRAQQAYQQFKVLEADDVASAVEYILACPPHVQIHDVLMRSTEQTS